VRYCSVHFPALHSILVHTNGFLRYQTSSSVCDTVRILPDSIQKLSKKITSRTSQWAGIILHIICILSIVCQRSRKRWKWTTPQKYKFLSPSYNNGLNYWYYISSVTDEQMCKFFLKWRWQGRLGENIVTIKTVHQKSHREQPRIKPRS
jgi:hypothetical protein